LVRNVRRRSPAIVHRKSVSVPRGRAPPRCSRIGGAAALAVDRRSPWRKARDKLPGTPAAVISRGRLSIGHLTWFRHRGRQAGAIAADDLMVCDR
jgi:hypothetical protein